MVKLLAMYIFVGTLSIRMMVTMLDIRNTTPTARDPKNGETFASQKNDVE